MVVYVIIESETGLDAHCANSWIVGVEEHEDIAQEYVYKLNTSAHDNRYFYYEDHELNQTMKYR